MGRVVLCSGVPGAPRQNKRARGAGNRNPFGMPQPVRVADMMTPRATTTGSASSTERHPRAPITAYTARGTFPTAPLSDEDRQRALDDLERDTVVPSTSRVRQSNWRTWLAFHHRWFGMLTPPLPLTSVTIRAVAAQMKSAHYRSFPGYLSAAKEQHLDAGHAWGDEMERTRKRCVASTQRGIGPPRQSIEIPPARVWSMQLGFASLHDMGPVNPAHRAVLCAYHMLRGAESSCALASSLTVDEGEMLETFALPGSKTDPQAIGSLRTWGCVCLGDRTIACPYHSAVAILTDLRSRFGDQQGRLPASLPLFPNAMGEWCSREGFITTIAHFADRLQLDAIDLMGRGTIGEHVWRVSGSRMLAHANVPVPTIALMARWGSDVIMRYVELAPLSTITATVTKSLTGANEAPPPKVASAIVAALQVPTSADAHDDVAEESLDPPLPPPRGSRYALNTTTGALHIIARRRSWGRLIPGRTNCGRDYLAHDYRPVSSLSATFMKQNVATPNTKCFACAKSAAWVDMEAALDDASVSE